MVQKTPFSFVVEKISFDIWKNIFCVSKKKDDIQNETKEKVILVNISNKFRRIPQQHSGRISLCGKTRQKKKKTSFCSTHTQVNSSFTGGSAPVCEGARLPGETVDMFVLRFNTKPSGNHPPHAIPESLTLTQQQH